MSNQDTDQGVGYLFRSVRSGGGKIASFISFITTLFGFVQLVRGDLGLLTGILLTIGIGSLLLICGFIYFKKVTIGESVGFPTKRPAYSKTSRRLALAGLFSIPILVILSFAGWQWYQSLPPDKIIVLVANFQGPEEPYRLTETLITDLQFAIEEYKDVVDIEPLNEVITSQQGGSEVARFKGKEHKAAIVLWGGYRVLPAFLDVALHFELLPISESLYERPSKELKVSELNNLEFQITLKYRELEEQIVGQSNYATLLTVGLIQYKAGILDGAIDSFTKALKQGIVLKKIPLKVVYLYRGNAYYNKGNYPSAIADYKQALIFNSDLVQAYNNLGNAYAEQRNYELAIQNYDLAIQLKPNDADYYYNRGLVRAERKEYDLAIEDYGKAIKLKHDFAEAYNNLGLAYAEQNQFDLAIMNFNEAINHNPKLTEVYNNLGSVYDKQGNHKRAVKYYTRAIKQNPNFIEAYYNRGNAYLNLGNYKRAIKDYTQVIQQKSDLKKKAYMNRGNLYARQGEYNRAIADTQAILALDPNDAEAAEAYNNIGFYYAQLGNYDLALTNINKAISLRPKKSDQAYDSRGFVYAKQGKYELAIADYNQAIKINPDLATTYLKRGSAYKAKGDKDRAITDFKKVLELTEHLTWCQQATWRQQAEEQLRAIDK
jgi:tetratricopeptide (TPR) repeat protein